ncbi:Glycosyl hydrolase 92 [Metarhizium album ARSEF 1941]|uniref:Glycosyl hydrolase 92 n=1 Tax=Metarhizium album (strain ARSEF 1941) TaxID=1081103 RepID=A0A0B2WMW3_METAS|nr:Glycosyl hydrolase 92 [Metarhizium album ARSEF 1941]KHN97411.1 Glycosyl hydrolase 92 [Metarhizium album ARSEF 1941]
MVQSQTLNWLSAALLALFPLANGQHVGYMDPLQYVDQLIGASNGGNVFPGATVPYGMAKAVADTSSGSNQGGFTLDGAPVSGFSLLHDSGTGGAPSLGNFPLFPYNKCQAGDVNNCAFPKKARVKFGKFANDSVQARPGYFGITLQSGPQVEMTTTKHAALFRFTFKGAVAGDKPLILQDLSDLSDSRQDNGTVTVDPATGRITGNALFVASFGQGKYRPFFCTDFDGADIEDSGIYVDSRASTDVHALKISRSINGYPLPGGAFVRFVDGNNPVYARVGLSFISSEQACANAEREMPDFDFNKHAQDARDAWRQKLSPITVDPNGVDESFVKNFYSGIYRTMVNPQNYTGENPLWQDGEPYFDSFYCIWDLFRSQFPFLTIIDPEAVAEMIRSLISTYEHDGWLPDCRMSFSRGYTQGGSNADNVLADAFIKGITAGIDWDKGYEAVKRDAEEEPYDWCCRGRGGIASWKRLGYVPVQDFDYHGFGTLTRSISRTMEYAYNDFCISQMAKSLGNKDESEKYIASSGNWRNLYKSDQPSSLPNGTNTGFAGFFQPRYMNKTWGYQDPLKCSNADSQSVCSLQNSGPETFESSIWEYGFFVPHDQAQLINLYGGPERFVNRLNYLHDQQITNIGNEPAFLTVFQYHYAGRPAESARRSHFYIPRYFSTKPDGLPGNDDSGAMGSFLAFSMMGLFPNPGQNVYLIIPPYFESVKIKHPLTKKTATIRNINFDPTYQNIYIQNATLDGRVYTKNWIDHSFFTEGKELVLTLGAAESSWGTAAKDLPPSLSSYDVFDKPNCGNSGRGLAEDGSYCGQFRSGPLGF